jgi:hypothetical protein
MGERLEPPKNQALRQFRHGQPSKQRGSGLAVVVIGAQADRLRQIDHAWATCSGHRCYEYALWIDDESLGLAVSDWFL